MVWWLSGLVRAWGGKRNSAADVDVGIGIGTACTETCQLLPRSAEAVVTWCSSFVLGDAVVWELTSPMKASAFGAAGVMPMLARDCPLGNVKRTNTRQTLGRLRAAVRRRNVLVVLEIVFAQDGVADIPTV